MQKMNESELVGKHESKLYMISLVFSILFWFVAIVGTLGIGLIYLLFVVLFMLVAHAGFIAYIQGNGVKVTQKQFGELDTFKKEIAEKMGFTTYTNMYVVNFDGMINAFATKFLSRNFIIITADLLESCENDTDKLKFIIAHELTHIHRKHVSRQFLLLPSKIIPWLGNAYSKACEYTCDNYGTYYGVSDPLKAVKGLSVLSAGGIYSEKINVDAYLEQAQSSNTFGMSLYETKSTHPYTTKRVHNIVHKFIDPTITLPKRNIFGILLAPFTSIWLWVFILYAGIIASSATGVLGSLNHNMKALTGVQNVETNYNIEYGNDIYEYNSYDDEYYKKLVAENIGDFWEIFQEYNGQEGWDFELYSTGILDDEGIQYILTPLEKVELGFSAEYQDRNGAMQQIMVNTKDEKDIAYFTIYSPYGEYEEDDNIQDLLDEIAEAKVNIKGS